ncbi:MAG TPA: dihydrofolate reductase [Novimethylophilus sp.]
MPQLSVIAALARNRVIGRGNALPWHLPEDLRHFKALTMGHPIVMGRKTYESLGRLLPGRTTVIVSRNRDYAVPGALVVESLQQALETCRNEQEIFIVGGAELYKEAMPMADRLYLTEIDAEFEGDAYFPEFARTRWREVSRQPHIGANGLSFSYVTYEAVPGRS